MYILASVYNSLQKLNKKIVVRSILKKRSLIISFEKCVLKRKGIVQLVEQVAHQTLGCGFNTMRRKTFSETKNVSTSVTWGYVGKALTCI